MAEEKKIGRQMAASYTVTIDGVQRTKDDLARLDRAITRLRQAQYSPAASISVASHLGGKDLLVTKIDALEGRVQKATETAMSKAMARARRLQTAVLRAATTKTGLAGRSHTPGPRKGPGREDTGAMIHAIGTNVETMRMPGATQVTGWHGWGTEVRSGDEKPYITHQEKGTSHGGNGAGGIEAANSLGSVIPTIREELKAELDNLR